MTLTWHDTKRIVPRADLTRWPDRAWATTSARKQRWPNVAHQIWPAKSLSYSFIYKLISSLPNPNFSFPFSSDHGWLPQLRRRCRVQPTAVVSTMGQPPPAPLWPLVPTASFSTLADRRVGHHLLRRGRQGRCHTSRLHRCGSCHDLAPH
jgi:hypothetical protein